MSAPETPLASVCCVTYNHAGYIRDALEGFLMQRADFPFEIIVHDDCSTDGTADIIRSYQQKYPRLIKPIFQAENQYAKGRRIFPITFLRARGQYLALCEGDDFWTDPHKLAKQVALLEAHPEYAFCFHPADRLDQASGEVIDRYVRPRVVKEFYTTDDLLEHGSFIPTCSVVLRSALLRAYPAWFYRAGYGDFALFVHVSQFGPVGFVDEPMAAHRFHGGGAWGRQAYVTQLETLVGTYEVIGRGMGVRGQDSFRKGLTKFNLELHDAYARERQWSKALRALWAALVVAPFGQKPYLVKAMAALLPAAYLGQRRRR